MAMPALTIKISELEAFDLRNMIDDHVRCRDRRRCWHVGERGLSGRCERWAGIEGERFGDAVLCWLMVWRERRFRVDFSK